MANHHVCMGPQYERYAADAAVLAQIGQFIFPQPSRVRVRVPRVLADLAVAAWERDEGITGKTPTEENPEQSAVRRQAGTLALIGLSIQQAAGGTPAADDVLVDLEAWHVGSALDAAENAGLLAGLRTPDFDSAAASASGHPVQLYVVVRIDFALPAAEPGARPAASSGPFQFEVVVKEVLPTAELASNEVRRLNALNQDKHRIYLWQATRYYASGRKA